MSRGKSKTVVILFNYGGGLRGLIPAHFMSEIEKITGLRMTDMVDIFAGPSTGSILNAALNVPHPKDPTRPRFKARHMVRFYEREGHHIFPADRYRDFRALIHDFNNRTMKISQLNKLFRHGHYERAPLMNSLKALYGTTKLSQTLKSLVIPVYNLNGDQLETMTEADETEDSPVHTKNNLVDQGGYAVWLKNMRDQDSSHKPPDVSLYDAVLASTAAPTYFPCHHFNVSYEDNRGHRSYTGIDGSIFDNPCISYHGAIRQHIPEDAKIVMVMFGTGHANKSFKQEDWNMFGGLGVVDPVNDLPLINILFHASETALIESFGQELGDNIYMFNKSLLAQGDPSRIPGRQIDDGREENLKKMRYFYEDMLAENKSQFDALCNVLVQNYEQNQDIDAQEEKTSLIQKISQSLASYKQAS